MSLYRNRNCAWVVVLTILMSLTAIDEPAWGDKRKRHEKRQQKAKEIQAENYVPGEGWEGYFRDEKGRTFPLIQPLEQNKDKDWMGLLFTDYTGPKLRLAVMAVDNESTYGSGQVPVNAVEELLMTSLFSTHRFELVERKAIATVMGEQDFGESGRVTEQSQAKVGKLLGTEYMIFATINEWAPEKGKVGVGGGKRRYGWRSYRRAAGSIKASKATAEVSMSFRVVDATSGSTLFATTEKATSSSLGFGLGGFGAKGFGGLGNYEANAPINYALVSCINKGGYKLAMWLKERPWSGSVVMVEEQRVYLNAGSDAGVEPGMKLTALSRGKELINPETGLRLGFATEVIGSVQVTTVNEKHSIATILQGCEGLKPGDKVELESSAFTSRGERPAPAVGD